MNRHHFGHVETVLPTNKGRCMTRNRSLAVVLGPAIAALIMLGPANAADSLSATESFLRHAAYGTVDMLQRDLASGADVNAKDQDGRTALMMATSPAIIDFLVVHGANINARDNDGNSALLRAASSVLDQADVVTALLEHGADVNARDKNGRTALILSTYVMAMPKVAAVLLAHGADPNLIDKEGKTALTYARMFSHDDIANLIAAHGVANPGLQLIDDVWHSAMAAVQLDLSHGADLKARDKDGKTALFQAAAIGNMAITQLLLDHGADVNAADNDGDTVLMAAVGNDHPDIVNLLLAKGADPSPQNKAGQTALELSYLNGQGKMTQPIQNRLAAVAAAKPKVHFLRLFYDPTEGKAGYHMVSTIKAHIDDMPGGEACGPFAASGPLTVTGTLPDGIVMPAGTTHFEGTPQGPGDWTVTVHYPGAHCTQGDTADYGDRDVPVHFHITGDAPRSVDALP
jgi:ankyrin repeat protein